MATGDIKLVYASSSSLTFTSVASLPSDSNFLAGAEATAVDNSSNKYLDFLLAGSIRTGTTPTASKELRVYVIGMLDDTTWPDVFDGTDSSESITNSGIRDSIGKLAAVMVPTTSSNVDYPFGPISVAALFGGVCPRKFTVWVVHNTASNLNSAGHAVYITPVYENVSA